MPQLRVVLAAVAAAVASAGAPPVVLVPGLTGSGLEEQMDNAPMPHFWCTSDTGGKWMRVWVQISQVAPGNKACLLSRLQLTYDAAKDEYSNLPGVKLRAVDFGGVGGITELDPGVSATKEFNAMIEHLQKKHGYEVGKNLHGAPYDFRLAGDAHTAAKNGVGGYYPQLKKLIEDTVKANGKRAVVVSHSLGCPTMLFFFRRFVSEEWRTANIEAWVALSGPWLGAARQASSYTGGDTLGLPTWLVPHDYVKPVQVNATSGVWLSPHPKGFGDVPIISTPTKNYTAAELPKVISMIGDEAGGKQTLALFAKRSIDLGDLQGIPSGIKLHNWYSSGTKTPLGFRFDKEITQGFNRAPVETTYSDGDGTVNIQSLRMPETWEGSSRASIKEFPSASHFAMLSDTRVFDALSELLTSVQSTEVIV